MASRNHDLTEEKARLREQMLLIRNRSDPTKKSEKDENILIFIQKLTEIISSAHVFCYLSMGPEPDTHQLIDWLLSQAKRVSIPKIIPRRQIIAVEFPGWAKLHTGQYGISEPESEIDISAEVEVCVTPGLCFDNKGNRLGHGAGYYDRWLSKYSNACSIAPAYDYQILESVPASQWDKSMDLIVTESRVIRP